MKKKNLLNQLDRHLLDDLYGYCYKRCASGVEAEDLCSDIVLAVVEAAQTEGTITSPAAFIWKIAHNVHADYCRRRATDRAHMAEGDHGEILAKLAQESELDNEDAQWLRRIWRQIAFLSRAYREVMILYYLEEQSISQIAKKLGIAPNTVRQRLFSARTTVRNEVTKMTHEEERPLTLQPLRFVQWGTGDPHSGNPWEVCERLLSCHIVWSCRNKATTAGEIAAALNVPMPYVEEELEIQTEGKNGEYGLLRRLDNGRYTTNFILLDEAEIEEAHDVYRRRIPKICDLVTDFLEAHKEAYLRFPYINKTVTWNLILWQQISHIAHVFSDLTGEFLKTEQFADVKRADRPFSVFGYRDYGGPNYGGGWDGVGARHVCGYKQVYLDNIYITRISAHFHCGLNVANDVPIQLAIRAVHGLPVATLSEGEKEQAAKAIACGYLYREDDMLYTKFLVSEQKDYDRLFAVNEGLKDVFCEEARQVAAEIAALIRKVVPARLLGDYVYFNSLAALPVLDALVESLIDRGLLIPPKQELDAEGVWMSVEK